MKVLKYLLLAAAALLVVFVVSRFLTGSGSARTTDPSSAATVAVARVERATLAHTIRLSAEFRAYQEIDVHAKVAGFIKSIPVDIGDRVKQGATLATLEVPELQEDLNKAQAGVDAATQNVKQAEAGYQGVHSDFTRLEAVSREHPRFVAQQELDNARAKDQSAAAALASAQQHVGEAQAEQKRQLAMVDYSKITAPFDGVVTKRYADVGSLIQAGTSSSVAASAVVRFAQENVLRAMFPVPESAVSAVHDGAPVEIRLSGLDRKVPGKVTRYSHQLDPQTRTMETEVDLPNDDLAITPGMFGSAELTLDVHKDVLCVPVQALKASDHPTLYVIDKNNRVQERPVELGIQTPDRAEVVSGVSLGELVFIGNRSQVHVGATVQTRLVPTAPPALAANNG